MLYKVGETSEATAPTLQQFLFRENYVLVENNQQFLSQDSKYCSVNIEDGAKI